jgi:hypothetical protein
VIIVKVIKTKKAETQTLQVLLEQEFTDTGEKNVPHLAFDNLDRYNTFCGIQKRQKGERRK